MGKWTAEKIGEHEWLLMCVGMFRSDTHLVALPQDRHCCPVLLTYFRRKFPAAAWFGNAPRYPTRVTGSRLKSRKNITWICDDDSVSTSFVQFFLLSVSGAFFRCCAGCEVWVCQYCPVLPLYSPSCSVRFFPNSSATTLHMFVLRLPI